jgi:hypothetical protein
VPLKTVSRLVNAIEKRLDAVLCNVCGKLAPPFDHFPAGFHVWELSGGYGDQFPADLDTFQIVVCEDCLKAWVDTFKHPDVMIQSHWPMPKQAKHCEDLSAMTVYAGWVWPTDAGHPPDLGDAEYPDGEYPTGVWRHFKGRAYEIVEVAQHVDTKEHWVVYQALYGDSDVWVRPLAEWHDQIDRETYKGPRFKQVLAMETR